MLPHRTTYVGTVLPSPISSIFEDMGFSFSVYMLTYHMVFVTKWRKPVISDKIGDFMKDTAKRLCLGYGGAVLAAETDRDHLHLLVSMPPTCDISLIVRSLKTQLSKEVHAREDLNTEVQKYLHGNVPMW